MNIQAHVPTYGVTTPLVPILCPRSKRLPRNPGYITAVGGGSAHTQNLCMVEGNFNRENNQPTDYLAEPRVKSTFEQYPRTGGEGREYSLPMKSRNFGQFNC